MLFLGLVAFQLMSVVALREIERKPFGKQEKKVWIWTKIAFVTTLMCHWLNIVLSVKDPAFMYVLCITYI